MDKETITKLPNLELSESGLAQLNRCVEFINTKRPDLEENLISRFQFLTYKRPYQWRLKVMSDFAPLSFYFDMEYMGLTQHTKDGEWKRDYNGGIIFHGNHDGGGNGGAPTFSVNLSPVDGWSIHT